MRFAKRSRALFELGVKRGEALADVSHRLARKLDIGCRRVCLDLLGLVSAADDVHEVALCAQERDGELHARALILLADVSQPVDELDGARETVGAPPQLAISGVAPKVSWGYSEEQEALVPAYDVEKAKSLLAEAGYPDGFDIVLTIGTQNAYVQAATLVQEQLKQIGVNVEIQSVSSTEVTDRYLNNKVQLWINGQGGSADPATFVGYFLNSDKIHTNYNAFCYSDPATDAIINEALTLTDQQERKDLYEELNEIALKTNIAAFYATTKLSWGLRKEVHGFVQENKAVMRVCGLEGSGINIWKEK